MNNKLINNKQKNHSFSILFYFNDKVKKKSWNFFRFKVGAGSRVGSAFPRSGSTTLFFFHDYSPVYM